MAVQIQQFSLGDLMRQGEQIKSVRMGNQLAQVAMPYKQRQLAMEEQDAIAGQRDAQLKRDSIAAKLAISALGSDFDALDPALKQERFANVRGMIGGMGVDVSKVPEQFTPDVYRGLQALAAVNDGSSANVQSTYINDKGQRVAVMRDGSERVLGFAESNYRLTDDNLVFDPRGGTVALPGAANAPGAPAASGGASGADLIAQQKEAEFQRRLRQLEAEGQIEIKTAGGKKSAEIGAEVAMAPQVAGARAIVAGAEQGAKASAQAAADLAASFNKKAAASENVMQSLDIADQLLDQATGSYAGAFLDEAGRFFGKSTEGSQAIAGLKIVQADLMLGMPRMEGPQSDRDVQLYREAAAQVGDPTVPVPTKRAAIKAIRQLQNKYRAGSSQVAAPGGVTFLGFE